MDLPERQGQNRNGEIFLITEFKRPLGQYGRDQKQRRQADHASKERIQGAHADSPASLSPKCHGMTVKGGGHRGRRTRYINEDGRDQAPGNAAYVNPQKQGHAIDDPHAIGKGQRQGNSHGGCHTRAGSEKDAQKCAQKSKEQAQRIHNLRKTYDIICHNLLPLRTSLPWAASVKILCKTDSKSLLRAQRTGPDKIQYPLPSAFVRRSAASG